MVSAMSDPERTESEASEKRVGTGRLGLDRALLELLMCPVGGGLLRLDEEHGLLISRKARLGYPVRDGVAIMMPDEAVIIDEHDPRLHGRSG